MVTITPHLWKRVAIILSLYSAAQTSRFQQHTPVRAVVADPQSVLSRPLFKVPADVRSFDDDTHQGATLGIILCLTGYVQHEALKRREAVCTEQHIKHLTDNHKIQAGGRTQLCNHWFLVWYAYILKV